MSDSLCITRRGALERGEYIEFPAVSKKTGNPYTARGRLKDDRTYGFGFRLEFDDKPKR